MCETPTPTPPGSDPRSTRDHSVPPGARRALGVTEAGFVDRPRARQLSRALLRGDQRFDAGEARLDPSDHLVERATRALDAVRRSRERGADPLRVLEGRQRLL